MLVISLFVIVVMALLGFAMTQLLSASSDTVVQEVYGLRALNAAQSGVEAKIAKAFPVSGSASCNADNEVFSYGAVSGLQNCIATTNCRAENFAADNLTYYRFTSEGQCAAGKVITYRQVAVDAKVD